MPTINQPVDTDAAQLVAEGFGVKVEIAQAQEVDVIEEVEDSPESLQPRPPIVTVMGHVDHGKLHCLMQLENEGYRTGSRRNNSAYRCI